MVSYVEYSTTETCGLRVGTATTDAEETAGFWARALVARFPRCQKLSHCGIV